MPKLFLVILFFFTISSVVKSIDNEIELLTSKNICSTNGTIETSGTAAEPVKTVAKRSFDGSWSNGIVSLVTSAMTSPMWLAWATGSLLWNYLLGPFVNQFLFHPISTIMAAGQTVPSFLMTIGSSAYGILWFAISTITGILFHPLVSLKHVFWFFLSYLGTIAKTGLGIAIWSPIWYPLIKIVTALFL